MTKCGRFEKMGFIQRMGLRVILIMVVYMMGSLDGSLLANEISRNNYREDILSVNKSGQKELFEYLPPHPPRYEVSLIGLLLKTIIVLGIIGCMLFLVARFFVRGRGIFNQDGALFQIVGTQVIAPNKYMQLIEMGDSLLVIGITENNITLLKEIKDKETIDLIKTQTSRIYGKGMGFSSHLKRFLSRFQIGNDHIEEERKISFLKEQRSRLRKMGRSG